MEKPNPMRLRIIVVLFLLIVGQALTIVHLRSQYRDLQQMDPLIEQVIEGSYSISEAGIDREMTRLQRRLEDEAKAKYRPLIPFIEKIRTREARLNRRNNSVQGEKVNLDTVHQLLAAYRKSQQQLMISAQLFLHDHQETFGIDKQEANAFLESFRTQIQTSSPLLQNPSPKIIWAKGNQLLAIAAAEHQRSCLSLIRSFADLSGGRATVCDFGPWPLFFQATQSPKPGLPLEGIVILSNFQYLQNNGTNKVIFINGQEYPFAEDGVIYYSETYQPGENDSLHLRAVITNPITGLTWENEMEFAIRISH